MFEKGSDRVFLYNIPGSVERSVLNVFNVYSLHSYVKVKQLYTLNTIMYMVVNYYGQKYAERSYGYS